MTIVQTEDTRNLEWRKSNIGSAMLAKMGWTEGGGIGKRNVNTTALRAVKRREGLGIGAKIQTEGGNSESTGNFAAVLANLQKVHGSNNNDGGEEKEPSGLTKEAKKAAKKEAKKAAKRAAKKKSAKKSLSLPQNKVLAGHARKMREAKFGAKSEHDLACIFGNTSVVQTATGGNAFGSVAAVGATSSRKKRSRPATSAKSPSESSSSEDETPDAKARVSHDQASEESSSNEKKEAKDPAEEIPAKKKRKKEKLDGEERKKKKSKKEKKKKSKTH